MEILESDIIHVRGSLWKGRVPFTDESMLRGVDRIPILQYALQKFRLMNFFVSKIYEGDRDNTRLVNYVYFDLIKLKNPKSEITESIIEEEVEAI